MPSLDSALSSPQNIASTAPATLSTPVEDPNIRLSAARIAELEGQLTAANTALSNNKTTISELQGDKENLYNENERLKNELSSIKSRFDALAAESVQNLNSLQASLKQSHAEEISHIRQQMDQQRADMEESIRQLKSEKAEMQGVVQLLQQKIAQSSSSTTSSPTDIAQLNEEKSNNAALTAQIRALTLEMEADSSSFNQQLEEQKAQSKADIDQIVSQHKDQLEKLQQDFDRRLQQANENAASSSLTETSHHSNEVDSLKTQLSDVSKQAQAAIISLDAEKANASELRSKLAELTTQLAEKEESLKRASEQTKSLQSQTSANFAQVEQMKQQVLRDRAELSKKLSLIAPETVRRVEQLTNERDAINNQFEEVVRSLAEVSKQKSEILSRLAQETTRNSALVKQNTQLRHQLSLQLSALGEPIGLVTPPESSIQDSAVEVDRSATSATEPPILSNEAIALPSNINTQTASVEAELPVPKTIAESHTSDGNNLKHRPPRRKHSTSAAKKVENIHPETPNGATPHTDGAPSSDPQKKGWLSSVPLVGRIWNGQPQVRHTAHVEI